MMMPRTFRNRLLAAPLSAALALALSGCVSFGPKAPDSLLTLTPASLPQAGSTASGTLASALAVMTPSVPQRLNATRVPVRTGDATLAYLQEAFWVEKPAYLFQNLVAETIRARGSRLVVDGGDIEYAAATQLSGQLVEMSYDAPSSSVLVVFDAMLTLPGGEIRTRRFEAREENILPDAISVGPALNTAANRVAVEVADWVGS